MGRSCSNNMDPESVMRRSGWNDRHHVTYSSANQHFHDNDREYFGLFLSKRSERVLQPRHRGLTYHYKPLHQPGNPDGVDEGPTPAELLVQHGRNTVQNTVGRSPGRRTTALNPLASMTAPAA